MLPTLTLHYLSDVLYQSHESWFPWRMPRFLIFSVIIHAFSNYNSSVGPPARFHWLTGTRCSLWLRARTPQSAIRQGSTSSSSLAFGVWQSRGREGGVLPSSVWAWFPFKLLNGFTMHFMCFSPSEKLSKQRKNMNVKYDHNPLLSVSWL